MATNQGAGLTRSQLERLLSRFDADPSRAAEILTRLRMRLEVFFAGNGCRWPDELADRALDVLAQKLFEAEPVESPAGYAFGVARHLLMEERRNQRRAPVPLDETYGASSVTVEAEEAEGPSGPRIDCLKACLRQVEGGDLFVEYHRGDVTEQAARRQNLARRTQLTPGGLRNRVFKVRRSLEHCVAECERAREAAEARGKGGPR